MAKKPSASQIRMLKAIHSHGDPFAHCRRMGDYGGADRTLLSLKRRGWLDWGGEELTTEGRALIGASKPARMP